MTQFKRGFKAGIPIGLGYISVSFSFGIIATSLGFSPWQAVLISALTVTSAGQLAGIGIMASPGQYLTMLISQATINVRYSFMAIALSQKTSPKFNRIIKALLGFFITDEIFAVASGEDEVEPVFFFGLATAPYLGWTLGTLIGSLVGNVLPDIVMDSLCIAFYGMFLAIIIPPSKKSGAVLFAVLTAAAISILFYFTPYLSRVPFGIAISISAVAAATVSALLFPVKDKDEYRSEGVAE